MTPIKIRPSKRPLARLCPSSILKPKIVIDGPNPMQAMGQAVHSALAVTVEGLDPDFRAVAARWTVPEGELRMLHGRGVALLAELRDYLPEELHSEVRVEGPLGGGTIDVLGRDPESLADLMVIIDWKTGWGLSDAYEQLCAYAHAATYSNLRSVMDVSPIKAIVADIRQGTYETWDIGLAELDAFEARDQQTREDAGTVFSPGSHCGFCPHAHNCEAREEFLLSAQRSLPDIINQGTITPDALAQLYPAAKALEALAKDVRAAIRSVVELHGPTPTTNGKELAFGEKSRDTIDPRQAWDILMGAGFSQEEMAQVLTVRKSAVENIEALHYEAELAEGTEKPRRKMKRKKDIVKALREGGAITTTHYQELRERKIR